MTFKHLDKNENENIFSCFFSKKKKKKKKKKKT